MHVMNSCICMISIAESFFLYFIHSKTICLSGYIAKKNLHMSQLPLSCLGYKRFFYQMFVFLHFFLYMSRSSKPSGVYSIFFIKNEHLLFFIKYFHLKMLIFQANLQLSFSSLYQAGYLAIKG